MKTCCSLKYTVILISLWLGQPSAAQELRDLFYCHAAGDIENIWLLGNKGFVGHVVRDQRNFLVYFDNERLPTDTLEVGDNTYHYLQALVVLNDSTFQYATLNRNVDCVITGNRFQVLRTVERVVFEENLPVSCGHYFHIDGVDLWLTCSARSSKVPASIGYYRKGNRRGEIFNLAQTGRKRTKAYIGSSRVEADIMYNADKHEVYFSLEGIGRFVVFNTQTLTSRIYTFPVADYTRQSYCLFYDHLVRQLYAVAFNKNQPNRLFQLLPDYRMQLRAVVDERVEGVFAGKIYLIREDKKKNICHYLVAVGDADQAEPEILENVEIKRNRK